jgi:uncharacterized protein
MITNKTKNEILVDKSQVCVSSWSKAIGLMFSMKKELALIFTFGHAKKVPLHMWFVFYPIDVLFLDEHRRVVEIKRNFKPFTYYNPRKKSKYVLELPVRRTDNTDINDQIDF